MNDHPALLFTAVWLACGAVGFALAIWDQGCLATDDIGPGLMILVFGPCFLLILGGTFVASWFFEWLEIRPPGRVLWRRKGKP